MIAATTVSGCFRLPRVDAELEQTAEAFARLGGLEPGVVLDTRGAENPNTIIAATPAVATCVALGLAERPQGTHRGAR